MTVIEWGYCPLEIVKVIAADHNTRIILQGQPVEAIHFGTKTCLLTVWCKWDVSKYSTCLHIETLVSYLKSMNNFICSIKTLGKKNIMIQSLSVKYNLRRMSLTWFYVYGESLGEYG